MIRAMPEANVTFLLFIYLMKIRYETVADVPEIWVWRRADFQSGSKVLKKGVLNFVLSIYMAYNVILCQKVVESTQILKIAKLAV